MMEMWETELDQRQQQQNETVDEYASAIQDLYQRVNTAAFQYPDQAQARKFISGLHPELYMAVKPFGDQTLTAAINRAKACELTRNTGMGKLANFATKAPSETSELVKLVTALTTHVTNLEKKIVQKPNVDSRRYNNRNNFNNLAATYDNNSNNDNRPPIVCYACNEPGHISRRCPKRNMNNNNTDITNTANNSNVINSQQDAIQALIKQLNSQTSTQSPSLN